MGARGSGPAGMDCGGGVGSEVRGNTRVVRFRRGNRVEGTPSHESFELKALTRLNLETHFQIIKPPKW